MAEQPWVVGWDVGGAHVKACVSRDGRVHDVVQWPCPLWQGLDKLQQVLHHAHQRWPLLDGAQHRVTMTGEMADLFTDRQHGVHSIAALMADALGGAAALRLFAGPAQWRTVTQAGEAWADIASANWLATAHHAAQRHGHGVLVDIGSTTTDLIGFADGRVQVQGRSDAGRLASGELVYHGVVRTPLCALGPQVPWQGAQLNVMNEFFATSADVHRLLGDLDPQHDQHPAADNGAKTEAATCARLARMIGLDARDGTAAQWRALAGHWRGVQVAEIGRHLRRVRAALPAAAAAGTVVSAGCGDALVADVLQAAGWAGATPQRYGDQLARLADDAPPGTAAWAQVAAPAVAVALLWHGEQS